MIHNIGMDFARNCGFYMRQISREIMDRRIRLQTQVDPQEIQLLVIP